MSIKIFRIIGGGDIIGEVVNESETTVFLKFPGSIVFLQDERTNQVAIQVKNFIQPFYKNNQELIKKFPLKKTMIFFSGDLKEDICPAYQDYVRNMIHALSGIRLATPGDMNKLPSIN